MAGKNARYVNWNPVSTAEREDAFMRCNAKNANDDTEDRQGTAQMNELPNTSRIGKEKKVHARYTDIRNCTIKEINFQ